MNDIIPAMLPALADVRRRKRGYSTAYTPTRGDGRRYLLARVPAKIWDTAQLKARREGVSMRALLIKLLDDWTATHAE